MNKIKQWAVLSVAVIGLVGCGLLPGVGGQQLLGSFQGDWATGVENSKLRLTLVGLGGTGITTYDNQLEIKDPNLIKGYVLELPKTANEASYQLVAYSDDNANSRLDAGEPVLGNSCSQYMLYANASGGRIFWVGSLQTLESKQGWNRFNNKTNTPPTQSESYPNFDLYRSGVCPA